MFIYTRERAYITGGFLIKPIDTLPNIYLTVKDIQQLLQTHSFPNNENKHLPNPVYTFSLSEKTSDEEFFPAAYGDKNYVLTMKQSSVPSVPSIPSATGGTNGVLDISVPVSTHKHNGNSTSSTGGISAMEREIHETRYVVVYIWI